MSSSFFILIIVLAACLQKTGMQLAASACKICCRVSNRHFKFCIRLAAASKSRLYAKNRMYDVCLFTDEAYDILNL
jgi:hypothetical protein